MISNFPQFHPIGFPVAYSLLQWTAFTGNVKSCYLLAALVGEGFCYSRFRLGGRVAQILV